MPKRPRSLHEGIDAITAFVRVHSFGGDPRRPPVGQPWTFAGERGQRRVELSLRDICDATVRALRGFPGLGGVDLDAVAQAIACEVEKAAEPAREETEG